MRNKTDGSEDQRQRAAEAALSEVRPGMRLGIGSGRTAEAFVGFLGAKVRAGLDIVCVPTSERTGALASAEGIRLTTLDETPALDLVVDGADEIGPGLALIKGGGGALLREKIVASASGRMLVIAEEAKLVPALGAFPLPIEVVPFGLAATRRAIERAVSAIGLSGEFVLRQRDVNVANAEGGKLAHGGPFVTDGGHYILDASFGRIPDPVALARALDAVTGVVEHGLFIGIASAAIVARSGGRVERILP